MPKKPFKLVFLIFLYVAIMILLNVSFVTLIAIAPGIHLPYLLGNLIMVVIVFLEGLTSMYFASQGFLCL